jgi:uncharacterized membrane protein
VVVAVVAIVAIVAVVMVGSVVLVTALSGGDAAVELVPVEAAGVPPELPHAVSVTAPSAASASSRSSGFMQRCSGIAGLDPSSAGAQPVSPGQSACQYPGRNAWTRSEELRQTPQAPWGRFLAALHRWLPFWQPQLVVAVAIGLQLSLSEEVTIGPSWLFPALEGALLIGLVIASPRAKSRDSGLRRHFAIAMIGLVSAANIASLLLLSHRLLHGGKENGRALILSGIVLWCTNVLLFGLWYWEVDRGGPAARDRNERDVPDFLFPQMISPQWAAPNWMPKLIDYLYLSLTNATAFSPTDTMPMTPAAKWLMSAQSIASLVTVALVVSRAVNILS